MGYSIEFPLSNLPLLYYSFGSKGFSDIFLKSGLGVDGRIGVIPPAPIMLTSGTSRVLPLLRFFLRPGEGHSSALLTLKAALLFT